MFVDVPTPTPSLVSANDQPEPPFVVLCREILKHGRRGKRAQTALQSRLWPLDPELGASTLYREWEGAMASVQHLVDRVDHGSGGALPAPGASRVMNRQYEFVSALASLQPHRSAAWIVRAIEDLVGVSCLGSLVVPATADFIAIFDYHETARYAVCVQLHIDDPVILKEQADGVIVDLMEVDDAEDGNASDFFTMVPDYTREGGTDTFAAQKQQQHPKLMRWANAAAVYQNYLYFDRIARPYAALFDYT
jgi:hypothetical protein